MPSLSRDTLVLDARSELIETGTTAGQWTDAELQKWAQEANEQLTELQEVEMSPQTAQTVAGQEFVAYPTNMTAVFKVWLRLSGSTEPWRELRKAQVEERFPDSSTSSTRGKPISYMIWNGQIYLQPIPDQAYDLNIFGFEQANDLGPTGSGSSVSLIDPIFHPLIKIYMVGRAKQKMDDAGFSNYDAQYLGGQQAMRIWKEKRKFGDAPRMVKMVSGPWD